MRFSIHKDVLKAALEVASLAVTNDSGVITSSVLFEVEDGQLTLWSTDRRVMTKVPTAIIEDSLQGSGRFTVEAKRLSQWVSSVFEDVVDIEDTTEGVVMTCGDAKGHFASLDAAAFPDLLDQLEEPTHLFSADPETFINALKFVRPFIGESTSNNALANNFQVAELRGRDMLATDSHILAMFKVAASEDDNLASYAEGDKRFKVTVDEIKKIVTFLAKTCDMEFSVSKTDKYLIESDDGSIFGYSESLYNLPNIPGIPEDLSEPEVWEVDKKKLQNAVKALTATADPDDVALSVTASGAEGVPGVLTLSMKDALEKHESVVKLPVTRHRVSRETLSLNINHQFLTEPLNLYQKDAVQIGVSAGPESRTKYVKLHEVSEEGDVRICLITLRLSF